MKKLLFIIMGLFCSMLVFGQTNFQHLPLSEAVAKAKVEKKMIFVDLYTSWCIPCKVMADNIFPDLMLGQFMNERFVCVKYDTDKDEDGKMLMEKFSVRAYPTFLILNVNQELENQIVGGVEKPEEFRVKVEEALKASMATLNRQYNEGNRDAVFLRDYLNLLLQSYMIDQAKEVADTFLASVSDEEKIGWDSWFIFEDDALTILGTATFDYLLSHFEQFGNTVGKEEVLDKISRIFETKLVSMLQGRDETSSLGLRERMEANARHPQKVMKDLDEVSEQIAPFRFNAKQRLNMYVQMCGLIRNIREGKGTDKDRDDLLTLCEKVYPMTPGNVLRMFYFQVLGYIGQNETAEQKERIMNIHRFTLKYSDCTTVKAILEMNHMVQPEQE